MLQRPVKRNNLIITILFSLLGVLLLLYFTLNSQNERPYQWQEDYQASSDQPYGTLFIKELLESFRPGEQFLYNDKKPLHDLLDSAALKGPTDYIFIGQHLYLDSADVSALLNFIYSGNDAFIASNLLPLDVVDSIFANECSREIYVENHELKSVTSNFYHPALHTEKGYAYSYRRNQWEYPYSWRSLNPEIFCDSVRSIIPLGYQEADQINFCSIPYGEGNLFVHTSPIMFTNYFLCDTAKATYAAGVFSHLRGKAIIWDEFSKLKFTENDEPYSSPLSYILQHNSLKYAWWMMLVCAVLYTLFTAKRKQRVIPVLEKKVNTSLEYVKMISALHFQNGNHLDIARKKMKYFLYFIRARYGLHTQNFSEAHISLLAEKSKVDMKDVQIIFNEFDQVEQNFYNNPQERLVTLYNAIDNFYKHCK